MDFRPPAQAAPSFLDPSVSRDTPHLTASMRPQDLGMGLEWDGGYLAVEEAATGMQMDPYTSQMLETSDVTEGLGLYDALGSAMGGLEAQPCQLSAVGPSAKRSSSSAAQNSSRAARNGREQQRAQKISDMIDKLKGTLDRAKFTNVDCTSKLQVLMNCESYIRSLLDRTRCYELEAQLRETARGNRERSGGAGVANGNADPAANDIDLVKDGFLDGSLGGDEDSFENADGCGGVGKDIPRGFYCESSSRNGGLPGIGPYVDVPMPPTSACESGTGSSTDDGDAGSMDGSGGADNSVAAGDSASQGFTTDSSSRGFTTDSGCGDSSLAGDSGSACSGDAASGDAGSADGGSEGSYEGTSGQRMRVVNYFDIFRLSNVPMAIASKDGTLVDVNDAMRGFGRIDQDAVKSLTIQSLVAPESSQALEEAMKQMLSPCGVQEDVAAARGQQGGASQPFLAKAGIGDRPTLLTVSLVCDELGEASAFHVALIPRGQKPCAGDLGHRPDGASSNLMGAERDGDASEAPDVQERRGVRLWGGNGDLRPLKRRSTDSALLGTF